MAYATYTFFEGELVTVMHEGRRRDVATDPQGSVVHLMTSFFVLSDSLTYWPYGEQRTKSGGINIPFHYAGAHGYYEDTSNRLYVRARYYRADLGNWITKDPLWPEEPAYAYVRGNPINYVDPSGNRRIRYGEQLKIDKFARLAKTEYRIPSEMIKSSVSELELYIKSLPEPKSKSYDELSRAFPTNLMALWWGIDNLQNKSFGQNSFLDAPDGIFSDLAAGTYKCNIFVAMAYLAAGAGPIIRGKRNRTPPGANTYANPLAALEDSLAGRNWGIRYRYEIIKSKDSVPGDIVAFGSATGSGHVTLKISTTLLLYAGQSEVKIGQFNANQIGHNPAVFRRYREELFNYKK